MMRRLMAEGLGAMVLLGTVASGAEPASKAAPEVLPFDAAQAPKELVQGKVVGGARWKDSNGETLLVLSEKPFQRAFKQGDMVDEDEGPVKGVELTALLGVREGKKVRVLRKVWEASPGCSFDNTTHFLAPKDLEVTDLDKDGVGEVTFAYQVQCTSDVSPASLKLLILEGGDKYIVRGTTKVQVAENETMGGERQVDASLEKGPPAFLKHALGRWERFVTHRWEQE
ncbi:M949_RS01915 family surface polysaccharide biosynthesis protein [Hyalangium versicolor]|uniref:M949_RS01915 family surface polysaccharide biosynthesis protein n=1 Tax=Hyalangium versicolor TaxID=2861190 RepID=UPI001CD0333B|nr:hypothetical protein [Hyalangium versicolor]